jgi:hypothetical protein
MEVVPGHEAVLRSPGARETRRWRFTHGRRGTPQPDERSGSMYIGGGVILLILIILILVWLF